MKRLLIAAGLALTLAACNDQYASSGRSMAPVPPRTVALMAEKGMSRSDPILVRLYKKESELEIWKKAQNGQYALLKTYPICRWSGQLGPKQREGDRQAPEGFYTVTPGQMNPNSAYYLSFDTGYPNAFDRAHGRTGSQLMVHGTCSSRGCFAMTDEGIAEVYALAREAFAGGQKGFQLQAYPFRMTAENLTKFRRDPNMPFWANLKQGSDHFEVTKREPKVAVCGGRYAFDGVGMGCTPDPTLAPVVAKKEAEDREAVAALVAKGVPAVKVVYADGGGHETFREASVTTSVAPDSNYAVLDARPRRNLGDVSRPDALAAGPREIALDDTARPNVVAAVSRRGRRDETTRIAAAIPAKDEVAARPGHTVLASADPDQAVVAAAAKPFYERLLSGAPARPSESSKAATTAQIEAPPQKSIATQPAPHKAATSAAHGPAKSATEKAVQPARSLAKAEGTSKPSHAKGQPTTPTVLASRRSEAAATIPGAAPIGPLATTFKTN